ncbi:pogo transposable element derived with ZNF domain b [Scyliorhinus canicula]|uniref:pogo transposable element derived with ZNF domain b n=1 Tax=Scyliorhinus canicula TaxID=7830 RepID=UPI0018F7CD28|nr:pogo transposable element derived with ZNF domain b [Scyliorhinus canicula]
MFNELTGVFERGALQPPSCTFFFVCQVGERRGRSARVTEEEAPASEPRPSTPDFEIEEEESVGVQDSSAEREANDDSPGPPADEIQKPVAKSQQVKTVRLSTVCSTNYINAKISSRPPVAASPPPAPSKDAEASSPIYVEGEKSSSGAIYIAEDKNGSSPEYVAEDKIGSSPTYVAEDENDSSLVCVQEGKRRLTPDCVDEERSLTPECVEEERSSTPGCVEEDQRSLTPECVEEERSSTPGFVEERSSTPGFVEERSSTPGFVEERSLTPECVDEERSLTPECVDEERSLTPECVDEERSLTPECVEERSLSPECVEERSLTPECVDEERSLTPECVDEETSLNPECAEEERSLTPGCVEEDKRRLTPEGNEVKRRLSPVSAEEDSQLSKGGDDSESQPKDVPWTRKPLSEHEFRVVLHALCCGMQAATERYGASRSQVEHLLNECAQQLDLSSGAEAGSRLLSPEAEEQLVEWVLVQRERQLPLTEETFLHRLSKLLGPRCAEPAAPSSCLWAVGFLLRHNLIAYAKITVARKLPREMEESVQSFVEFAQQQIVGRDFPYCMIGNMDEIPIFLDPEALRRPEGTPGGLEVAGTGEPQFVIVFTILADGNLLPTMIFSRGGLPPWLKVPAGILLEVKEAGYSEAEVLELWLAKVWRRHMATRYRRTMLVLDSSRRHLSDDFIDHLSRCNSLPLVVPGGCTSRAQPLDMCIGQTLRSFLQKRWAEYSREAACFRDVYGDVLQSLLNWVAEVAGFVASNADVVQQSFLLASVLPGPGGRPASVQQKVEAQEELVSFLQEQLELSGKLEECGDGKAPPTLALDPRLLTRLFEADSEAESFYGFSEGDL